MQDDLVQVREVAAEETRRSGRSRTRARFRGTRSGAPDSHAPLPRRSRRSPRPRAACGRTPCRTPRRAGRRQLSHRHLDAHDVRRVVQWRQRRQSAQFTKDAVVDDRRFVEHRTPWTTGARRTRCRARAAAAGLGDHVLGRVQAGRVVGDAQFAVDLPTRVAVHDAAGGLTDPFHRPVPTDSPATGCTSWNLIDEEPELITSTTGSVTTVLLRLDCGDRDGVDDVLDQTRRATGSFTGLFSPAAPAPPPPHRRCAARPCRCCCRC